MNKSLQAVLRESGTIEDPASDPRANPFIILQLNDFDYGDLTNRTSVSEYVWRNPICVSWSADAVDLTITNLGLVASDLITIDYQYRTCVDPSHRRDEGWVHDHFGEAGGNTLKDLLTADYVPAAQPRGKPGAIVVRIPLPEDLPQNLANLYFRARVATLWTKPVPPDLWSFANDRMVVESTR